MERILEYKIDKTDNDKTIEQFLKQKGFPRNVIVQMKKTNEGICRNGIWAYTIDK